MIVYSFDPASLEFVGVAEAFESPLEPGVFLLPANATEIAPPDFDKAVQICTFNGTAWTVRARPEPDPVPPLTPEEVRAALAADLLKERTLLLADSDWLVIRHQDEVLSGVAPTLTAADLAALLKFRQELRDITTASDFPECGLPGRM